MSEVKVNKISPRSGTTVTLGDSGDTFTLASGVSLTGVNATFSGDLTVDTDTLYVDSTNNRVGIGTSSPSEILTLSSSTPVIRFIDSDNSKESQIVGTDGNLRFDADNGNTQASTNITFRTDGSEAMRIDSSGLVSLAGDTDTYWQFPSANQQRWVCGGTETFRTYQIAGAYGILQVNGSGSATYPNFTFNGDSNTGMYRATTDTLAFTTGGSERMRIDSSGNVLVSTTDPTPSENNDVSGISLRSNGQVNVSVDGGAGLDINRKTSNGQILRLRKDGTDVAQIGTQSGTDCYIGSSSTADTGLRFQTDEIVPVGNAGGNRGDAIDLGKSNIRWKDFWLSGSIYIGGTTSANALDDYEEGTFTPLVEGTTTSGSATYTTRVAKYTKVGNIVHFSIFIRWQSGTGTGPIIMTGLPFTSVGSSYHSAVTIGWMNDYDYTNGKLPRAYVASSVSNITFEESTDNGGSTLLTYDSQAGFILSGSYETT